MEGLFFDALRYKQFINEIQKPHIGASFDRLHDHLRQCCSAVACVFHLSKSFFLLLTFIKALWYNKSVFSNFSFFWPNYTAAKKENQHPNVEVYTQKLAPQKDKKYHRKDTLNP